MEKKPLYESPKVSRLDENDVLHGGIIAPECDSNGSGALGSCISDGNSAGIADGEGVSACADRGNSPLFAIVS